MMNQNVVSYVPLYVCLSMFAQYLDAIKTILTRILDYKCLLKINNTQMSTTFHNFELY